MLQSIVLIGHMLVAVLIIVFVLLQRGKGAEAGTGFGAGASGTVFGSRGTSNFFSRTTAVLAAMFFATSLVLAYFAQQGGRAPDSLLEGAGSVLEGAEPTRQPGARSAEPGELPELPAESGEPGELPEVPAEPGAEGSGSGEPAAGDSSD